MASSKKSKEEENKKKKTTKTSTTSTSKPKKPKTNNTTNGTVKNGAPEVIIVPSSSCDSQESQEQEVEEEIKRSEITNHKSNNKSKRKEKEEEEEEEEEEAKMCVFPMSRIKRKIKSEGSDSTLDAVFLVNKASEMFIEQFCEDAYECSVQDRKKSLHYNHLSSVVSKQRRYDFLSDFVPEKLKAEDALAEWKSAETGGG